VLHAEIVLAVFALAIWLYLFLFRGRFWLVRQARFESPSPERWPSVVAIVPARDEAATIARAVDSLVKQNYPGDFSIIIVDDHSDDGTAEIARRASENPGASHHVKIHSAPPLATGWTGKLSALNEGVHVAARKSPAFFWFTDADISHSPDTLARLVSLAESESFDLVSLMVLLQANTFPERLLIPPFLYFFLMLYPPRWIANPRSKTAGAAGGCILLRSAALDRIGGLASIRNEVIDDCALARAVKKSGGKLWMGLTRESISLRGYCTFSEIRDMIARTAFTQLRYSNLLLLGTLAGMLLTYIAPVALIFSRSPAARFSAVGAFLLMTLSFFSTVRFYGLSPIYAVTLPVAALFYSSATFLSALRFSRGHGGQWKGRSQARRTVN
jgi:hopene-associated glycosyltransferase HpnB